jgi:signal transduction histidine kinase
MDREEALLLLKAPESDNRLRAARFLVHHALEGDIIALQTAFSSETHKWVKGALTQAISSATPGPKPEQITLGADDEEARMIEELRAEAVEETAKRFVHELRPIIGRLDVCAGNEISDYQNSTTKTEWKRLQGFLGFIADLGSAAATPDIEEFDLAATIESIAAAEQAPGGIVIQCAGPKPFLVLSSEESIHVILSNALRNAIEASKEIASTEPVIITWGITDKENWITVLDRGVGLPRTAAKIYKIGITTKKGHMGVGLSLALQTAHSLNGSISLSPRDSSGTAFEFKWQQSK